MKQKLLEMVEVTVLFHTDEFIYVWSFKNGTGAKTAPRVQKLGYFDGRVPKLSSRMKLATSGAGVVCHIYYIPITQHKRSVCVFPICNTFYSFDLQIFCNFPIFLQLISYKRYTCSIETIYLSLSAQVALGTFS